MVLPPAPANMSMMVSLRGVEWLWEGMSLATLLEVRLVWYVVCEKSKGGMSYMATGSGVTPNQASSVRRMS